LVHDRARRTQQLQLLLLRSFSVCLLFFCGCVSHSAEAASNSKELGDRKWHFFISHAQATGGDQAARLCDLLKARSFRVWYDNDVEEDINTVGMKEGAQRSKCFLLFLSKGVLTRPLVQLEIREALAAGKPIILVHETDERHGKFEFFGHDNDFDGANGLTQAEVARLKDVESIKWERKSYALASAVKQIVKRYNDLMLAATPRRPRKSSFWGQESAIRSPRTISFNESFGDPGDPLGRTSSEQLERTYSSGRSLDVSGIG